MLPVIQATKQKAVQFITQKVAPALTRALSQPVRRPPPATTSMATPTSSMQRVTRPQVTRSRSVTTTNRPQRLQQTQSSQQQRTTQHSQPASSSQTRQRSASMQFSPRVLAMTTSKMNFPRRITIRRSMSFQTPPTRRLIRRSSTPTGNVPSSSAPKQPASTGRRRISSVATFSIASISMMLAAHKASKVYVGDQVVKGAVDLDKNPQKYTFTPKSGSKGRLDAAEYLSDQSKFPKGTVGYVVGLGVKAFAIEMEKITAASPILTKSPEFASGNIGEHYRSEQATALLLRPANKQNMLALAQNETNWWRAQDGIPGLVGGTVTVAERTKILVGIMNGIQD